MSTIDGVIRLQDGNTISYSIFKGEDTISPYQQLFMFNNVNIPKYYLYLFGNWYVCGYDGWRAFLLGKEDLCYLNLEGHWVRKKVKDNIDFEKLPNMFHIPDYMGDNLYWHMKQKDNKMNLYWEVDNKRYLYKDCDEKYKIISLFLTQFFPDAWFSRNKMKLMLKGIFCDDIIIEYEKSFDFGVWMVNPFTWKIKLGPLSAPFYATYYNFIEQKPFASFSMNGYGKKKK